MIKKNHNSYKIINNNNPYSGPSFLLSNRLLRFIWNIFKNSVFRFSPRTFHKFRVAILKLFGAKIGKCCRISNTTEIWAPWNLVLNDYVLIAEEVKVYNMATIRVGSYSVISQGAFLCTGSHNYNYKNFPLYAEPITLKKNIWICAEAFIHPGVKIEDGIVIGARSVVTKTLKKKWSVYFGNPVKCLTIRKSKK